MDHRAAIAIRRSAIAGSALTATLGAHFAVGGGFHVIMPFAPLFWMNVVSLSLLVGMGRGSSAFRPRSPLVTLVLVGTAQAAIHVGVVWAPWAFALKRHHEALLISPGMVVAHLVAAVVLTALLSWGERILAAALAVAAAILGRRPQGHPRPLLRVPFSPQVRVAQTVHRPRTSRGPPPATTAAVRVGWCPVMGPIHPTRRAPLATPLGVV
ncbi:MAG: hypothetical protein U0Y82_00995 [Thermoleophilia bacterium]